MSEENITVEEKSVEGLGGWLSLVGLGIIFAPVRISALLLTTFRSIFTDGTWEAVTTPGEEVYHALWGPILLGEVTINSLMVLVWILIAVLFFRKKKIFTKWYIGILLFSAVFILVDALLVKIVLPDEPVFDADTIKELLRSVVASAIWIPYMLKSKRVKATFVN